jgi:formylmethanofuran dehydrogenase subunit A
VVVDDAQIIQDTRGRTLHVAPDFDLDAVDDIQAWFESTYSIQFRNYPVGDHYLLDPLVVPTS